MLNCVIVGAGRSGSHLMMRPLLNLRQRVNILAICDQNIELASSVAARHGILGVYASLAEALQDEKIDVVCVSTPHSTHYEVAKLALENDCSVIVEKPFTETLKQAKELMALSDERSRPIVVMHNHKFYRGMVEGKNLLNAADIGSLVNIHCNWISSSRNRMVRDRDHWVHKEKGGIFKEVLPHALYGTYNLIGELELVDVQLDNAEKPAHIPFRGATICLKNKDNVPVTMRVSFDGDYINGVKPKPLWLVQGSKDALLINYGKSVGVSWSNKYIVAPVFKGLMTILRNFINNKKTLGAHNEVITRFIDHIENGGPTPVSALEIMNTMSLTDKICDIIEKGKSYDGR